MQVFSYKNFSPTHIQNIPYIYVPAPNKQFLLLSFKPQLSLQKTFQMKNCSL
jgi:hypothetical protein